MIPRFTLSQLLEHVPEEHFGCYKVRDIKNALFKNKEHVTAVDVANYGLDTAGTRGSAEKIICCMLDTESASLLAKELKNHNVSFTRGKQLYKWLLDNVPGPMTTLKGILKLWN